MKFSVVIIAFNEEKYIAATIAELLRQDIPREEYEVIVVIDGKTTDNTAEIARGAGADKVVVEPEGGTNINRQRGVAESRGEIVAFLDADCAPPADWLEKIGKMLSDPRIVAVSGPYNHGFTGFTKLLDSFYNKTVIPNITKLLHALFRRKAGVLIGGNMAIRRQALEKIGGLPRLKFYGDDAATAMLLARNAGEVLFTPELVVKTSPRRFKKGLFLPVLRYAWVYLKIYFSKLYR
jgi:glycosyltransferase involved in cell wall biosynthesis